MNNARRRQRRLSIRGFTLIELVVAVGLFAVIATLAAGGFLVTIAAARHAETTTASIDNLSFALESMVREIRTGSNYRCNGGGDCVAGTSLTVRDADGVTDYTFTTDGDGVATGAITQNGSEVTDSSVVVSSLKFYVTGSQPSDGAQAQVTIVVSGTITAGPGQTVPFTIETGATARGVSP